MDSSKIKIKVLNAQHSILHMQFCCPDFLTEGCDKSIEYTIYDNGMNEIDGGQMDFDTSAVEYGSIIDAISDLICFVFNREEPFEYICLGTIDE